MNNQQIFAAIDDLVSDLSEPLTSDQVEHGWTLPLKERWLAWFSELRTKVETTRDIPAGWGITRAMDFDGITGGDLAQKASHLGQLIDAAPTPTTTAK